MNQEGSGVAPYPIQSIGDPQSSRRRAYEAGSSVDRAVGSLLGLAVGDALGTTLEFLDRDTRPHHTEMTGGGPFRLKPGVWTDDTAMALALADSLVTRGKFDAADLMARFVRWWEHGEYSCTGDCFDIGNITRESLERFLKTGNPYAGPIHERSAGNGSLMRTAPVAIYALQDEQLAVGYAREQSRTTHGAPVAVEACALFTLLLREAIEGESNDVLERRPWKGHGTIRSIAAGEWKTKSRDDISSSGYVVATLEAALWCVDQTNSFEEALVLAVNLADDADTVGAVTGQLAGALYGASSIPDRWLQPLAWRERIEATALDLVRASTQRPSDRA